MFSFRCLKIHTKNSRLFFPYVYVSGWVVFSRPGVICWADTVLHSCVISLRNRGFLQEPQPVIGDSNPTVPRHGNSGFKSFTSMPWGLSLWMIGLHSFHSSLLSCFLTLRMCAVYVKSLHNLCLIKMWNPEGLFCSNQEILAIRGYCITAMRC